MCAGTDKQVHLIIFTCARYVREREKGQGEKKYRNLLKEREKNKKKGRKEEREVKQKKAERLKRKRKDII